MNEAGSHRRAIFALFASGLVLSVAMALRGQIGQDQFLLQLVGWEFFSSGRLLPYGAGISGGGLYPGSVQALLSGLPLFVHADYRSVNFAILATHVVAYVLLDRALRGTLDPRERVLLCVFYWLNPWRAYFSAHLLNTNPLFLLAVVHLWTAQRQRRTAGFWYSLLHVLALGIAFQLHASFLILAVLSVFLVLRGYVRFHWPAVGIGAVLVGLTLVPYALAMLAHPEVAPLHRGFPGRGLLLVYPVLRGALYWLRYGSLLLGRQMNRFDFTPDFGPAVDALLAPALTWLVRVLGPLGLAVSLVANLRLWSAQGRASLGRLPATAGDREWLAGYARLCLVASLVAFALSPTTIMVWQVLIVLHAAILPTIFWIGELLRGPAAGWVRRAVVVHTIASLAVIAGLAFGGPQYRKGGRKAVGVAVVSDHPMLHELGIAGRSTIVVDPERGKSFEILEDASSHDEE